jgi:PhoH-like ATPase
MGILNFYDTSALLNLNNFLDGEIYVSNYVLAELENIKTSSHKDDALKAKARKVTHLLSLNNYSYKIFSKSKLEKIIDKYDFLSEDSNDHLILAEAIMVEKKSKCDFHFITSDLCLYNFSLRFPNLKSIYIGEKVEEREHLKDYYGWKELFPNNRQMNSIYSSPELNIFSMKENEYCKIYEGDTVKDILKWSEGAYKKLHYKEFKSSLGEKIKPRNIEQKMLFDLLQNNNIPIKLCLGRFGSGKSYLALAHALWLVGKGEYQKIVFVKNNIEVKDSGRIGLLPGSELEKLSPYLQQIADHIGQITLEDYIERNTIEPVHLGFIRGRDLKNSIIIADEAENLTKQHIQLLIGRVSTGSALWICGDMKQVDAKKFELNSGIQALIDNLAGNPLFGMVKLMKSERSETAALADLLD